METFSALLALCVVNSMVTGEFPSQRPVTWSFDVFFDLRLNKWLSKQSWGWWFETPSSSLWRHCNDLEIWWMALKNNRAPLLTYFKLCASFCSHWWIQTGVTVQKPPIWVKIGDFLSPVTLKFDRWPWKTIGSLFYATSSYVHHFIAICEFKLELWSGKIANWGSICIDLCHLDLWPLTLTFCMDITFVNGNNCQKFEVDTMIRSLWKRCDRWTDGRMTDGRTEVFLELLDCS